MHGSVKHTYPNSATILNEKTRTLIRMDFQVRLIAAMNRAGVNGAELGRAIGISSQAISLVLSGRSKALTAENTAKAARFLSVDQHWLATGEGQITPATPEARGLTPEALSIARWFDRLTEPRERAQVETQVMGVILRALQRRDLPPSDGQDQGSEPGIPPAPDPPHAPTTPPKPEHSRSGKAGRPKPPQR
jgi:transcriptional regulator with XRE-family HTH domain